LASKAGEKGNFELRNASPCHDEYHTSFEVLRHYLTSIASIQTFIPFLPRKIDLEKRKWSEKAVRGERLSGLSVPGV